MVLLFTRLAYTIACFNIEIFSSRWCFWWCTYTSWSGFERSSPPEVFSGKNVLKICSTFTGEHPCWSVIPIKILCNFIEITLRHRRCPVNLLHIFRKTFHKKTYGELLLFSERYLEPPQTFMVEFFGRNGVNVF